MGCDAETKCTIQPVLNHRQTGNPLQMSFRRLAERISRGVVLSRRLPAKFGRLHVYVTPEAGLRYWLAMSRVDPTLYRMVEELVRPGATVWDVGANVGLFSFCAAALSGPSGFRTICRARSLACTTRRPFREGIES